MPTPEELQEAAEDALRQAEALMGETRMSDREFLESMARGDSFLDHDIETCGQCCHRSIMAQTARDLLAEGEILDGVAKWAAEFERRWQETKYFQLWRAEEAAGRDPHPAFKERGWEP